jgi:hypothetical protein
MMNIFKRTTKHPDQRKIYAVTTGDYVGEMFIYIDDTVAMYNFLSVPKNINRVIPKEKFDYAMNTGIIEYVETAPKHVYRVAAAQYKYNENTNNRRKQPDTPDVLDS